MAQQWWKILSKFINSSQVTILSLPISTFDSSFNLLEKIFLKILSNFYTQLGAQNHNPKIESHKLHQMSQPDNSHLQIFNMCTLYAQNCFLKEKSDSFNSYKPTISKAPALKKHTDFF